MITKLDLDNAIIKDGLNYQDSEGNTFLHNLARDGKVGLIVYLLRKRDYDINTVNNLGRTALFDAFNEETVEILLLHRINYKLKDNEGNTADEINSYVNYILNQKCNETKRKIMKGLGLQL